MNVLDKLATNLQQRDEKPNIALAVEIVENNDGIAVRELVENLNHKKKDIQYDCIKALYEIGERKPDLIAGYYNDFLNQLENKNQRMIWGSICALSTIAQLRPKEIFEALPAVLRAVDATQSVIARDHTVYILAKLAQIPKYAEDAFALLVEIIMQAPINQLAMYAEYAGDVAMKDNKTILRDALICRLEDVNVPAKRKRIEKVLKKLEK